MRKPNLAVRYVTALGFVTLAITVRVALSPWLQGTLTHPTVFLAVLLAAWYCGVGPAIAAAILGYLGIEYFLFGSLVNGGGSLLAELALYGSLNAALMFFAVRQRRSRERYRCFVEASAQVVWTTDATGQVVLDIPAWQGFTGQTAEEARGFGWMNAIHSEDRAKVTEAWRRAYESRSIYEVEYLVRRYDGAWRHILARGVPIKNSDGSVREYIGTCIDITEQRRAEGELRRSEEQLRIATLAAEIGVWSWTPGTSNVIVSANWRRLFDIDENTEVTLETWRGAIHPEDRDRAVDELKAASELRLEFSTEYRVLRRDGSVRWIVDRGRAWYDQSGRPIGMAGINLDITERKRLEDKLRATMISAEQAKAAAEHANNAKDEFLAMLSHELRTPLTPVLAAVQLIQRKKHLKEELGGHLEMVRRNLELEARLIDDLLDLTRIVRGKIALDQKALDISTVIDCVVEICRPDIEARRLHFGVDMGDSTYWVNADSSRLQQVLWNILKNAIKYTPDGGSVGIKCRRKGGRVDVEIQDSGIGIESESLPRMFNAFEQGREHVTRKFGGLGLGLAISKRLVEMHDGTITVRSEGTGRGATFTISLPEFSGQTEIGWNQGSEVETSTTNPLRILLVEDHGDTAAMMQMLLQSAGFEVEIAGDFLQAIEIAGSNTFDLLISDIGLPDRSGHELLQELRLRGLNTKAIAISGYGREEDVRRSQAVGFAAHLTKPVNVDILLQTVDRVVRSAA
jgi:PAS domain S-box-containing protein